MQRCAQQKKMRCKLPRYPVTPSNSSATTHDMSSRAWFILSLNLVFTYPDVNTRRSSQSCKVFLITGLSRVWLKRHSLDIDRIYSIKRRPRISSALESRNVNKEWMSVLKNRTKFAFATETQKLEIAQSLPNSRIYCSKYIHVIYLNCFDLSFQWRNVEKQNSAESQYQKSCTAVVTGDKNKITACQARCFKGSTKAQYVLIRSSPTF